MINDDEIKQKSEEFKIPVHDVQKDYVYSWILHGIYSHSSLSNSLILKGGNALRKGYFPTTRFSKDLDFSLEQSVDETFLHDQLNQVCRAVQEQIGVQFDLNRTQVEQKGIPGRDVLEARAYFNGFYGEQKITLKTQLDITQFDKIYLPTQRRVLLHPYSDQSECNVEILTQKAEEVLASKLNTLLQRRKVCDLFDLFFSTFFNRDYSVDKTEVVKTFLKKTIYENNPISAKTLILAIPLDEYEPYWNSLIAPVSSLFGFDIIRNRFQEMIDGLFSLIPVSPALSYSGGMRSFGGFRGGIGRISYFSPSMRDTIMQAGRSNKLVRLRYHGYERLVEPYELEYYVRKKDNAGNEYFWGYDQSGGESGKLSIKMFFCDQIESVSLTDIPFTPRYPVLF